MLFPMFKFEIRFSFLTDLGITVKSEFLTIKAKPDWLMAFILKSNSKDGICVINKILILF